MLRAAVSAGTSPAQAPIQSRAGAGDAERWRHAV